MRKSGGLLPVLLLCMAVLCLAVSAACANVVDSGDYGNNVAYTIDEDDSTHDYTLTISKKSPDGDGEMTDYNNYKDVPWYNNAAKIKKIQIENGITKIGNSAFSYCNLGNGIRIPGSVSQIGIAAFYSCSGLKGITLPAGLTSIGNGAFGFCTSLAEITIPDKITRK